MEAREKIKQMGAREKTKQMGARKNGLLLLVSGLLAFVCVALHKESKEHCETRLFHFNNWDILVKWVTGFCFSKLVKNLKLKVNQAYSGSFVF